VSEKQSNFNERFENWIHWCQLKGIYHGKAGSAEGKYRSPQTWEPQNPKPAWLITMDVNDAVLVNRAYSQLGEKTRKTIKVLFIKTTWRPQWQAQAIGCHWKELEGVGYRAKRMLENRLNFLEKNQLHTRKEPVTSNDVAHNLVTRLTPECPEGDALTLETTETA
jgi:hypothetical protein